MKSKLLKKIIFGQSYRYITRDLIKSIKEFDNPNPIYTKYCYLPSAYITEKGE